MIEVIKASMTCIGVWQLTRQGKLPGGLVRKINIPAWLRKPLHDCPVCMSSIWGIGFSIYFGYGFVESLLFVTRLAAMNALIEIAFCGFYSINEFRKFLIDECVLEKYFNNQ